MNTCLLARPRSVKMAATGRRRAKARPLTARQDYLWLCSIGGRVVGMAGVRHDGPDAARLCLFHVDPEWQHTSVPGKLIECVRGYSRHSGLSRIVMESRVAPRWLLLSMRRRGFRLTACRMALRQQVLEFRVEHGT